VKNGLKRIWNKRLWLNLMHYPGICWWNGMEG